MTSINAHATTDQAQPVLVLTLAADIAAAMGHEWVATEHHGWLNHAAFVSEETTERRLHLRYDARSGKLTIRGCLDRYSDVLGIREQSPAIGVTARTKSPARIAAEIERRLLPGYTALLSELAVRQEHHDRAEADKEAVIADLLATFGNAAHRPEWNQDRVLVGSMDAAARGDIRVLGDSVELSVTVSRSYAARIAATLAPLTQRRAPPRP